MEKNTPKFRLRLNLFDAAVLVAAVAVGVFLLWRAVKPQAPVETAPEVTSTVRYTIRFQRWAEGTSALIQDGDALVDNVKNYELGQVVSSQAAPSESVALDQENRIYRQAVIEGYEDVLVTLESPCVSSDENIQVGGGFIVRVGVTAYVKGPGYMGSGPIVAVEEVAE